MWKCNKCGKINEKLLICWGMSGGQKVDIIDYMCNHCPSDDLTFLGTKVEEDKYWEEEWSK